MTRRVFIVHGLEDNSHGNWFDRLVARARACGVQAGALVVPNPDNPTIQSWQFTLDQHISRPDENVSLVDHSLGCTTLPHFPCRQQPERINGLVLTAGFADPLPPLSQLDPYIRGAALDFSVLDRICMSKQCLVSDNDSHVPSALTLSMAERFNSLVIHVPNGGHLMDSNGLTELPRVWGMLKPMSDADETRQ